MDTNSLSDTYACAVRLLARREHSTFDLRQKLLRRGFSSHLVESTLQQVRENDFLSDKRYAEICVRNRLCKGDGPIKIRSYLSSHGISRNLISENISNDDEFWYVRAVQCDSKNCRKHKFTADSAKEQDSISIRARHLKNKGYPASVIYRVLDSSR